MSSKTNAVRLLDTAGISYELREYEVDEQDVSAEHVAETLGLSLETLYKTLVLKGNKDPYIVAVIPGNAHLDLKKIAKASGNKNCEMLPMKDLLSVTGYIRGGCSPIGMKKQFPTFIEEAAQLETHISVSAGKRGLQMVLNPLDLASIAHAHWSDLIGL
ncbi:MAG: Cys-tRNA(Pro) deacylase [Sphingobacterium sp.]|jgi:Cys-tRNA(Pro)/Cys-tRNA(Cys) deacylase|uniref:Cys-tRNA(Pro) deacylase n=1 Tax=unclassified Sphingobacterium TaxID=2609468 RepID=UPI002850A2BB|nr:Cys-tRNA(Pro) deacylase [Sphingobacterium sp.]MDR3007729.1 Cys-tRNA(Pro) deacylase [Sphingobacterium sp.]